VSDRLDEFRRQRSLLREHLAWLDREIAALEGSAPPEAPAPPAVPIRAPYAEFAPGAPIRARPSDLDAEAILAEYRQPPVSIQKQAKVGCLLSFVAALALMAVFVTAVYLFVKRAHAH
jgi:hypothetical protein